MSKVRLDKFDNSWYKPGSAVKRFFWYFANAWFLNSYFLPSSGFKKFLLRMYGAKIGKGVVIKPKVNIKYPWNLTIGDHCWIGENVWIDNLDQVTIGNHVCISQGALILIGNHDYSKESFDLMIAPVDIREGAWVGARSIVVGGTEIASHAVISVNSVAPRKTEAYTIYRGNPAKEVGKREVES